MADELDKIKKIINGDQGNVTPQFNVATTGLNLDQSVNQIGKGSLTYALNAAVENFDSNSVNYQNEPGNEFCLQFPEGYQLIGDHSIYEQNKHIFFLANPHTGDSEIGYMDNNDCVYHTLINAPCLNFNINHPIHKVVHRITDCKTEIYWTDGFNSRRYLDINDIPYVQSLSSSLCDPSFTTELDCNRLKLQPNFSIPEIDILDVVSGGELKAGTYQFAIQYSDADGGGFSSYYSVTNPTPIADPQITTPAFDYVVGRAIELQISNLDVSGQWQYFNLAVIKTINGSSSVELVGTYFIDQPVKTITYNGQNQAQISLSLADIFEKFPYYDIAQDLTTVRDILVWDQLTSIDRVNYQQIANQITLQWETWRIPATEDYSDEVNATNLRGYLRDEVYAFEIVFLLKNGKQTDGFHIPGRLAQPSDLTPVPSTNNDFIGEPDYTSGTTGYSAYWKIYNTANVLGFSPGYSTSSDYKGPYQYGEFAYWESTETYPCNEEVWGELANQPIRHHKFPDVSISPIFESAIYSSPGAMAIQKDAIYPLGVKIDISQVENLIQSSNLTQEQKRDIAGFKIVRGDRSNNKSIVAKGILRNVGKYNREGAQYYYPNYPYNDLSADPFLLNANNAYTSSSSCLNYTVAVGSLDPVTSTASFEYIDCYTNTVVTETTDDINKTWNFCALSNPGIVILKGTFNSVVNTAVNCEPSSLNGFSTDESKYRYVFNSPETSFGQPFLGNILKLENIIYGAGKAHFVQVKNNAQYKLLSKEAQQDAINSSKDIATITGFDASAFFAAYQAYLTIYINGITRRNYAYSFNSIASYDYASDVNDNVSDPVTGSLGIKQRELEIAQYLIPGVQSVGETNGINVNNFQRESSIYLKTINTRKINGSTASVTPLPFADKSATTISLGITDDSRFTISERGNCLNPAEEEQISVISYYGSLKNIVVNQYGQIYTYNTIDTGFQRDITPVVAPVSDTIFGGDTYISKFAFKTKLPFFIDNTVNSPDDADIYYDEIGNVAYPKYWFSARSVLSDITVNGKLLKNFISYKAHNLDCPNSQTPASSPGRTYYDGKMYLFAYGVPYFYCESAYNVDLRQAFNNKEGDFWPHVSTGIPDDWVQETNVSIANDNTYFYNPTFSKQNRENSFSHLPTDWSPDICETTFPFRAIYSDSDDWLIYRATSKFDFPQNYGKLVSLDGIQNKAILARFENKTLLYNNLLTIDTSNPQAAYIGNARLFDSAPPIDFAETDLGFVGSQNKMLLKIPQGQITVDAKRGQVFLIQGTQVKDLSAFGSGMNRWFTDHLAFEILKYFPEVDTDNHFNGIGLHGTFDSKYDRVLITKLDYIPKSKNIKYDSTTQQFYIERELVPGQILTEQVFLTDEEYFCNKSWTLSFNLNTNTWISFHSYLPNFYVAENNFFYSGLNDCCSQIDAIVAEVLPEPSTTTTTSTLSCFLFGVATEEIVGCELDGTAQEQTTTTTTSTSSTTTTSTSSTTTTTTTLALATINWSNQEVASPYVDSDLYIARNSVNVVTEFVTNSGSITATDGSVIDASQVTTNGTIGKYKLLVRNETDNVTLYDNTNSSVTSFPTTTNTFSFNVTTGKTYSVAASALVPDPTTTTTTTTVGPTAYSWRATSIQEGSHAPTCSNPTDMDLYTSTTSLFINTTILYTNPSLTIPYDGNNLYIALYRVGGDGTLYSVRVTDSGLVDRLTVCGATTTTTTTATPPASVTWLTGGDGSGYSSSSAACSTVIGGPSLYTAAPYTGNGSVFYTNAALTSPLSGGSLWYKVYNVSGGYSLVVQINSSGAQITSINCDSTTTTTQAPTTTTTTTTACPANGTFLYQYCEDCALYYAYANGNCGEYYELINSNSNECGPGCGNVGTCCDCGYGCSCGYVQCEFGCYICAV